MRWESRVCAPVAAASLVLLLSAPATTPAKPLPITGELSKPGYTVISLGSNGKADSVRVKGRRFFGSPLNLGVNHASGSSTSIPPQQR